MSIAARLASWLVVLLVAGVLAACASPPRTGAGADPRLGPWSGRLALQVEGSQAQSFSAAFELRGQARAGELSLYSPLGSTLALLSWAPGTARLKANGETREFESLDALLTEATGTAIPVTALFDWLAGTETAVAGWQADVSRLPEGRLHARRLAPPADLRVVLDH